MIERAELSNFTAFKQLSLEFSPGVNLLIGANGTGKTHLLKLLYTALSSQRASRKKDAFEQELIQVFLPYKNRIGRLAHRVPGSVTCRVRIVRNGQLLTFEFTNHSVEHVKQYQTRWPDDVGSAVYIPVKEMLADAPGFRSLYEQRVIHMEKVYFDIVSKAFLPILRGPASRDRKELLEMIEAIMEGQVKQENEHFFLKNPSGNLEFTLLAEGIRKFGLLWLLIQNGTLLEGATLFWDEPEANINPSMITTLVRVLLHLQSQGVQIFIATHSYVVLKEFDLQRTEENAVRYFSLMRDETGDIGYVSGEAYNDVVPNEIANAYVAIYDKEVERSLGV
jgi:ABC-type Mn2+/Zn2+ transport system ATPase subunit